MSKLSEYWFDTLMETSLPEAEAIALAEKCFREGYEVTSRRYRSLARLPEGKTGIEALIEVDSGVGVHCRTHGLEEDAADFYRRCYAYKAGLQTQLDLRTFKHFLKLRRGEVALQVIDRDTQPSSP